MKDVSLFLGGGIRVYNEVCKVVFDIINIWINVLNIKCYIYKRKSVILKLCFWEKN